MDKEVFKAARVSENVWWVGAIDWNIRDFHGYSTGRGSTYNAYLIMADRITLVDTVKRPFLEEMMARISSVVDPSRISVIISNHSEMDHSGSLPETIDRVQPDEIYASAMGVKALNLHFKLGKEVKAVRDGGMISLGNMDVVFAETRMIHWPDSMFSYLPEEQVLFSQDGFGMHLAGLERFADEVDESIVDYEAARYYANILNPFSPIIAKALGRLGDLNIDPLVIAPDHGPIWRTKNQIDKIIKKYSYWAGNSHGRKVVIAFDTMWGSTALMAKAIAEGVGEEGIETKILNMRTDHRSDLATELLDAGALIIGSPTINNNIFPTIADSLYYIKGLRFTNLIGGVFGSYGWGGGAVRDLEKFLEEMRIELAAESISLQYVPDDGGLKKCFEMGRQIGRRLSDKSTP